MSPLPVPIAGASLLEITVTDHHLVVGCPGCGAQTVFARDEEPVLAHLALECPVFQALTRAYQQFDETSEVRG